MARVMIENRWGATMVLTEPDAGSDVGAGRTKATAQPDGTWQRCTAVFSYVPSGLSSHLVPVKRCDLMGPGHDYPWDFTFTDPPTHIDD